MKLNLTVKSQEWDLTALTPHPLLQELGLSGDASNENVLQLYTSESKAIGYYDHIAITPEGSILSNLHTWHAQRANGVKKQIVDVIHGLEDEAAIRVINAQSLFFNRSPLGKGRFIGAWHRYLTNSDAGREFAYSLSGKKITEKVAATTGYGHSTVKMYWAIVKHNEALLKEVGEEDGQRTLREVYTEVQMAKKGTIVLEPDAGVASDASESDAVNEDKIDKTNADLSHRPFKPDDFEFSFEAGEPKLRFKGTRMITLTKVKVKALRNKLTCLYETEDGGTTLEFRLTNPGHLYE